MHETFRVKRSWRYVGLMGMLFFATVGTISVDFFLGETRLPHHLLMAISIGGVHSTFFGLGLWTLLVCWRSTLIVDDDRISKIGVFGQKGLVLGDVAEARWRLWPQGGSLVLKSSDVRMTIDFNEYTTEQRDALVRHLRSELALAVQSGWSLFAYSITTGEPKPHEPGEGQSIITRHRWDRIFSVAMLAAVVGGVVGALQIGRWMFALGPPGAMFALWVLVRFMIPKEGLIDRNVTLDRSPAGNAAMKRLVFAGVACFAVMIWANHNFGDSATGIAIMSVASVVFYVCILVEIVKKERRYRRLVETAAEAAALARGEAPEPRQNPTAL